MPFNIIPTYTTMFMESVFSVHCMCEFRVVSFWSNPKWQ